MGRRGGREIEDVAIVGGGIVGMASAMALTGDPGLSVTVLEAEDHPAAHQSGHNTGIIHSGIFYRPGTVKARLCVEGREALYRFCRENGIPHERCGKVVVAHREADLPGLLELEGWAGANGLRGVERLDPAGIRGREPHARGVAGLFVPESGIVDYAEVTRAFAEKVRRAGGTVRLGAKVLHCRREPEAFVLATEVGEVRCRVVVNCAGLRADRVARLCGIDPGVEIIPFRGQFYDVVPGRRHLVRNLIYPVPDLKLPFLGVHLTRNIRGGVEADPNGALVLRREGYDRWGFSPRDAFEALTYRGFWPMFFGHLGTGLVEFARAFSKRAFTRALRRMVPELRPADLRRTRAGVHAQAVEPDGSLVDDFRILEEGRTIHVLGAISPAATASIALGRAVADRAASALEMGTSHRWAKDESPTRSPDPAAGE